MQLHATNAAYVSDRLETLTNLPAGRHQVASDSIREIAYLLHKQSEGFFGMVSVCLRWVQRYGTKLG